MLGLAKHELDDVCLVIDMECFRVDGVYRCREFGYCSWRGDSGRVAIMPSKPLSRLTPQEKQQAHFLTREVHGLFYTVDKREEAAYSVTCYMQKLYDEFVTQDRRRVAFKGGHIERDLLTYLQPTLFGFGILGVPQVRAITPTSTKRRDLRMACPTQQTSLCHGRMHRLF